MLEHLVIPYHRTEILQEGVPCRSVRLDKIDRDLADDIEVLRGILVVHLRVVLAETHVQRSVKLVFKLLVRASMRKTRLFGLDEP